VKPGSRRSVWDHSIILKNPGVDARAFSVPRREEWISMRYEADQEKEEEEFHNLGAIPSSEKIDF